MISFWEVSDPSLLTFKSIISVLSVSLRQSPCSHPNLSEICDFHPMDRVITRLDPPSSSHNSVDGHVRAWARGQVGGWVGEWRQGGEVLPSQPSTTSTVNGKGRSESKQAMS